MSWLFFENTRSVACTSVCRTLKVGTEPVLVGAATEGFVRLLVDESSEWDLPQGSQIKTGVPRWANIAYGGSTIILVKLLLVTYE
jgi:hypothetical protein